MSTKAPAPPSPPRAIPIAPTEGAWRAMSPDQRARLLDEILDALSGAKADEAKARAELARARAEQAVTGLRAGILAALETRGVAVADELRDGVYACEDPAKLQGWLLRALTASTAEEVFSADPAK